MNRTTRVAILCFVTACTSDKPKTAEDSAVAARNRMDSIMGASRGAVVPPGESAAAPAPNAPAPQEPSAGQWEVTPAGIGGIRAGMSIDELNIVTHNGFTIPAKLDECAYIRPRSGPKGVALMIEKGIVSRVDVTEGTVATIKGAKIGDSEEKIQSLYPGQVKVMPHKYTDGHYLVVTPPGGGNNRIVFETDGAKVLRYRSGAEPAVEYVEGCS